MAQSLKLSDLKQGLIVKVEFGNGDILRGCFYGKRVYHIGQGMRKAGHTTGNYLVTLDPVKKAPTVVNINEYKDKHKTSFKEITGTRFPKEVSAYLKQYVKALAKQQEKVVAEIKLQGQREAEDMALAELRGLGKNLDYKEDADSLPFKQRAGLVFGSLPELSDKNSNIYHIHLWDIGIDQKTKKGKIDFVVGFESLTYLMDEEIGVTANHEYDGSYAPYMEEDFDVIGTVKNHLSISQFTIEDFIKNVNDIKGVKLEDKHVFQRHAGDYSGKGSIEFSPTFILDTSIKEADLQKLRQVTDMFILSCTKKVRRTRFGW